MKEGYRCSENFAGTCLVFGIMALILIAVACLIIRSSALGAFIVVILLNIPIMIGLMLPFITKVTGAKSYSLRAISVMLIFLLDSLLYYGVFYWLTKPGKIDIVTLVYVCLFASILGLTWGISAPHMFVPDLSDVDKARAAKEDQEAKPDNQMSDKQEDESAQEKDAGNRKDNVVE